MWPRGEVPVVLELPRGGDRGGSDRLSGGDEFDGKRWNDLHYTNAVKWAAANKVQGESGVSDDIAVRGDAVPGGFDAME